MLEGISRRRKMALLGLLFFAFTGGDLLLFGRQSEPIRIKSGPFVWPAACPNKIYAEFDSISCACATDENQVSFAKRFKYGLGLVGRSPDYYRVGDQIIAIEPSRAGACDADSVIDNVYYR